MVEYAMRRKPMGKKSILIIRVENYPRSPNDDDRRRFQRNVARDLMNACVPIAVPDTDSVTVVFGGEQLFEDDCRLVITAEGPLDWCEDTKQASDRLARELGERCRTLPPHWNIEVLVRRHNPKVDSRWTG